MKGGGQPGALACFTRGRPWWAPIEWTLHCACVASCAAFRGIASTARCCPGARVCSNWRTPPAGRPQSASGAACTRAWGGAFVDRWVCWSYHHPAGSQPACCCCAVGRTRRTPRLRPGAPPHPPPHLHPAGGSGDCTTPVLSACSTHTTARSGGSCASAARAPSPCSCATRTPASAHTLRGGWKEEAGRGGRWAAQQQQATGRPGVGGGCRCSAVPAPSLQRPHSAWPSSTHPPTQPTTHHQCRHGCITNRRPTLRWLPRPRQQTPPPARRLRPAPRRRWRPQWPRPRCALHVATGSCQSGWRLQVRESVGEGE